MGLRGALVLAGLLLPVLAVATRPLVSRTDDAARLPERQIAVLGAVPLFGPLPASALEGLAFAARTVRVPAGATVVREGDAGDTYYAVVSGALRVSQDGREVRRLGPGEGFGEIALLRDVPRTATVSAVDEVELLSLDRPPFLAAVTADPTAAASAETLVTARLAGDATR
jgi:CRP-like cAMP-binding protein